MLVANRDTVEILDNAAAKDKRSFAFVRIEGMHVCQRVCAVETVLTDAG